MRKYILIRRADSDNATITAVGAVYPSPVRAASAAGDDLIVHGSPKSDAVEYATLLAAHSVGAIQSDPETGPAYRILAADFTSDGRPILPGLRVLDYDRREGRVKPAQFMQDGLLRPGGEHFDHWYFVVPDGKAGRGRAFNGERLKTL